MNKLKKVSILIVNWDGKELLKRCLKSVKKHTQYPNYEVIVIDNGSEDGSQNMIKEEFKWVKLIENTENKGFSGANNQGIEAGDGDYFYLLNYDTEVTEGWLTKVVEVALSDEKIGVVGSGQLVNGKTLAGSGYVDGRGINRAYPEAFLKKFIDKPGVVYSVGGATMLIKKRVINEVGALDEGFNPLYFEETDFCARARAKGYKVIFAPSSVVYHWNKNTGSVRPWVYFAMSKNRIRYMLLNFSKLELIKALPWEILRIIKNTFKLRIHLLIKAYIVNLKDMNEILDKRRSR